MNLKPPPQVIEGVKYDRKVLDDCARYQAGGCYTEWPPRISLDPFGP